MVIVYSTGHFTGAGVDKFEGTHTNAVYGFLNIMFRVIEDEGADYLAVAFDLKEPTFRHKMYAAYKGTRKTDAAGAA